MMAGICQISYKRSHSLTKLLVVVFGTFAIFYRGHYDPLPTSHCDLVISQQKTKVRIVLGEY